MRRPTPSASRIAIIDKGEIKVSGSPAMLKEKVGGDILTIELSENAVDLTEFFRGIPDVSDVTKTDQIYRIKLPKTERALPVIVEGVVKKNVQIKEISFTKPTLDQVFLEVDGQVDARRGRIGERLVSPERHDGESEVERDDR